MPEPRAGTLVVLACHCVYDPVNDHIYTDRPEFVLDRPIYEAQVDYAFRHLRWTRNWNPGSEAMLVISGGYTKPQRPWPESRSYLEWVAVKGKPIPAGVELEEFALTSIENLLFSLYVYRQKRGVYPDNIDVISWAFKRERFESALRAIGRWQPLGESWENLSFFPVGDLRKEFRDAAVRAEQSYIESLSQGLEAYYANPRTIQAIARRDPFESRARAAEQYRDYPLPF